MTNQPETANADVTEEAPETTFAETALKLGGKSDEEARRTGAIDAADDEVEQLFRAKYQTVNSPAHQAVWDRQFPSTSFSARKAETPDDVQKVMDDSVQVMQRHRQAGSLLNEDQRVGQNVLTDLADAGYWGLLVPREFGGTDSPFTCFAPFLTRMAMVDATVAGLASVHGCIGAVDPVNTFGNKEQKQRFLPRLASGERLSAFALTEPGAGSDLTALKTRAVLDGDDYVVNGEKLFITNIVPGRIIGLVCLIDDQPSVLICELPEEENEHFQLVRYGLYALKHTYNRGMRFRDFRVPAANYLKPPRGNGLTIAYHGLNLGRISLCANSAGMMRVMLAGMLPWSHFRNTYGEPIANRELVKRRLGKLAGLIVAADSLVGWCSSLIDEGYRGEMECIVAKIFGSEAQIEAAIHLMMKTHGGRSFLHGHMLGDNIHEFLAPSIYEGEGEMLGMAFFKSLVKQHGVTYFEPIGHALAELGVRQPNLINPSHLWKLKGPLAVYSKWYMAQKCMPKREAELPQMPDSLRGHAAYAADRLQKMGMEISRAMRKHQLKLADRQCRMSELSNRVQKLLIILCTAMHAAQQNDEIVEMAAAVMCQEMKDELEGRRHSDQHYRQITKLGEAIADGKFESIAGVTADEILMPYEA